MLNIIISIVLAAFGLLLIFLGRKFDVKRFVEKDNLHPHYHRPHVGKFIRYYNFLIYFGMKMGLFALGATLIFVGIYLLFL